MPIGGVRVLGTPSVRLWHGFADSNEKGSGGCRGREYREYEDDGGWIEATRQGEVGLKVKMMICRHWLWVYVASLQVESMCAPDSGYCVQTIVQDDRINPLFPDRW